uniref:Ovule protein n=1 Tax=Steinernema glaseri TaxID=37863 RepID=A0A1I7YWJ4_9BILA
MTFTNRLRTDHCIKVDHMRRIRQKRVSTVQMFIKTRSSNEPIRVVSKDSHRQCRGPTPRCSCCTRLSTVFLLCRKHRIHQVTLRDVLVYPLNLSNDA